MANKLAGELGVTPQAVNNWRNGTMPNDQIICGLADLLDLTIEEIREGRVAGFVRRAKGYQVAGISRSPSVDPDVPTSRRFAENPTFLRHVGTWAIGW